MQKSYRYKGKKVGFTFMSAADHLIRFCCRFHPPKIASYLQSSTSVLKVKLSLNPVQE